jgi:hypothetical protein
MIVFDVYLNGRKLYRAGIGDQGVLSAVLTWVRSPTRVAAPSRVERPHLETRLHVGGLAGGTHRRWADRRLKVGDRVAIRVLSAAEFDPPVAEDPRDVAFGEREERKYYLRLKRKYERPKARGRKVPRRPGRRTTG